MLYEQYIIPFLIGIIPGFISGITGLVNMVIILASLSFFKVIKDYETVVGTGLYVLMCPITAVAVYTYYKHGKINFVVGNLVVLGLLLGGYFGALFTFYNNYALTEKVKKYITGFIAIFTGLYFVYTAYRMK